jgi:RNA polymerase sigma-70 factor (ECF subfamily)
MLRDVQGLNTAETAACLSITEQAVKTRLHRARTMLREDLSRRVGLNAEKVFEFLGVRCDRIVAEVLARIEHETFLDGPVSIDDSEIFGTLSETPD